MEPIIGINSLLVLLTVLATAVMAVIGVIQAVRSEFDPFGAMVLAFISAVGGGTMRDLLCGEQPIVLKQDLYATIAILGGALLVMLNQVMSLELSGSVAFVFIILGRAYAIRARLSLSSL